jgi:hypothetical protein
MLKPASLAGIVLLAACASSEPQRPEGLAPAVLRQSAEEPGPATSPVPEAMGAPASGSMRPDGMGSAAPAAPMGAAGGEAAPDVVTVVRVQSEGLRLDIEALEVEFYLTTAAASDVIARLADQGASVSVRQEERGPQ